MKNEPKDKQNVQYIKIFFGALFIMICLSLAIFLIVVNSNKYETIKISHTEKSSLDYKAYLKPNSGFTPNYRVPGQTIIPTVIDYIDVSLSYEDTYTNNINGSYEYYIKGKVLANKRNSDINYWEDKEINITEPKTFNIQEVNGYKILENININYADYILVLQQFKEKYPLPTDGFLVLDLMVKKDLDITGKDLKQKENYKTVLTTKIPLSEEVIEEVITNTLVDKTSTIKEEKERRKGLIYDIAIPISVISICIAAIIAVKLYEYVIINGKTYRNKLNKILTAYDGIIVTVNNMPSTEDVDVIEVNEFEELLNAHSEVRQPINFYEDKKRHRGYFILHNGNMAWKYVLRGRHRKTKRK